MGDWNIRCIIYVNYFEISFFPFFSLSVVSFQRDNWDETKSTLQLLLTFPGSDFRIKNTPPPQKKNALVLGRLFNGKGEIREQTSELFSLKLTEMFSIMKDKCC